MTNNLGYLNNQRIGELDIRLMGNTLTKERLTSVLEEFLRRDILVESLLLTSKQLDILLTWQISYIDINVPINLDIGRMFVRVSDLETNRELN
jgi:hypothetical protein